MERRAKRGVFSGHPAITGLMEIYVQDKMVDSVTEHPFTPRLEGVGIILKVELTGKGLRISATLSVGMRNGARRAAFNIPQVAFRPELAAHLIGIAAVNREIAGEAPMPIRLAPKHQTMLICNIPKTTQITFGNHIRHRSAQMPKELIGLPGTIDHGSG